MFRTVIIDQVLDITHDLSVTLMSRLGHVGQASAALIIGGSGLRMQHEWYGQETLQTSSAKIPKALM